MLSIERATRDGGVDALERSRRRDEPVAAERNTRLRIEQRTNRVGQLRTLRSNQTLGPSTVVDCVIRLHACDDVEGREARNVWLAQVLRMFDAEATIACAVLANDSLVDVELRANGVIADRVDDERQTRGIRAFGPAVEIVRRVHEQSAIVGRVAERLEHRGGV